MKYIGIESNTGDVYEGSRSHGVRVNNPVLLPYYFVGRGLDTELKNREYSGMPFYLFREDYFDPITKIKRGRFYNAETETEWYLQDFQRNDLTDVPCRDGFAKRARLITYQKNPLTEFREQIHYPDVILGREPFISIWKIISIETSFSGVPIVTLKSYRSLGELPELKIDSIDSDILPALTEAIEKLENSINRLGPTDVVDRCRDTLSVVFGFLCNNRKNDLKDSIDGYLKQYELQENMISWAARIVNRFHPRGKPNEQFKLGIRPPSEEDAQLSVRCVWLVLVELGWAVT